MSTSTGSTTLTTSTLSVNNQRGVAHIFILIVILLVVAAAVLTFLWIRASKTLNLTPPLPTETQYQNPFEDYQNPFEGLE